MRVTPFVSCLLSLVFCLPAPALEPKDVVVVYNRTLPASREVAEHYAKVRGVPAGNLIPLDLPAVEGITRADYDERLAGPLRDALKDRQAAVKVVLTVYGVPLRVGPQLPSADELAELAKLKPDQEAARKVVVELEKNKDTPAADLAAAKATRDRLDRRHRELTRPESVACVDSELMLLWWDKYPLDRWVANPLYFQASAGYRGSAPPVLLTARLDGPTPEIAKRLVDDAAAVEAKGLAGKVVIDARGIRFDPANPKDTGHGYGGYDESMREAARLLGKGGFEVQLDDKGELLPEGAAKGVALYCGWYSLANFRDSCEFVPGAVAWHLASSEAVSLRDPKSKLWCPNLLKKGVAATLGPVAEPYTVGFPKPAEFFGFLATGELTLVECYARTQLFCSWMAVLVGDPLYNPFKATPKLKSADVVPSPKGGKYPGP